MMGDNLLGEHLDGKGEDDGRVLLAGDGGQGLQVPEGRERGASGRLKGQRCTNNQGMQATV